MTREERWARRAMREGEANARYGMRTGAFPCQNCGKFKSRPSSVCGQCGDDPVSFNGNRASYDAAYGY